MSRCRKLILGSDLERRVIKTLSAVLVPIVGFAISFSYGLLLTGSQQKFKKKKKVTKGVTNYKIFSVCVSETESCLNLTEAASYIKPTTGLTTNFS